MSNNEIVQKLWNLCDILRDDGINYSDYVTELVLLLFIKMEHENTANGTLKKHKLPQFAHWETLSALRGQELLDYYRDLLLKLSGSNDAQVAQIYADAKTKITEFHHLEKLIKSFDGIDWFNAKRDGLGDLYEGLLEKNASETKSGAGQYFTPRGLIDSIIHLIKPKVGETIQDPAAGTAGFLIAANSYIRDATENFRTLTARQYSFQQAKAYIGMELVSETRRLALMNCLLHGIDGGKNSVIRLGNTLGKAGTLLPKTDICLSNPPFGTAKGGGGPTRVDFSFSTNNKQLAFLQHIYSHLKDYGRAAVILPDNVLYEDGVGADVRRELMDKCNLHTILRLPTGIFYAQGVKTNVLFFTKVSDSTKGATQQTWIYDMRANMPKFGKRTPFTRKYFADFENLYGNDPHGGASRIDQGNAGRFRCFSRAVFAERNDNLDITWLNDGEQLDEDGALSPKKLANDAISKLESAIASLQSIVNELAISEARK